MANSFRYDDPQVDDVVYVACSPVQVGRITRVVGRQMIANRNTGVVTPSAFYDVVVLIKRKGKLVEETMNTIGLRCYRTLLADHQRKADKMAASLKDVVGWVP